MRWPQISGKSLAKALENWIELGIFQSLKLSRRGWDNGIIYFNLPSFGKIGQIIGSLKL